MAAALQFSVFAPCGVQPIVMRLSLIVAGSLMLQACQAPNLPPVAEPTGREALTSDDAEVIHAAVRHVVVRPLIDARERFEKMTGSPAPPIPKIVVVDLTLRVCDPPEFDPTTCALTPGRGDIGAGQLARLLRERNQVRHRIVGALGAEMILAPFERVPAIWDSRSHQQFRTMYPLPEHDGPVYATAPTYIDGKSYLYVLQPQEASWVELERKDGQWIVLRGLGGWVA